MRVLISVSEKRGVEALAKILAGRGAEIISTGGTAGYLRSHGVKVTDVSRVTGAQEILRGRVKTLHPAIFGGILARRPAAGASGKTANQTDDSAELKKHKIAPIDWVIVNLYPFEKTLKSVKGAESAGALKGRRATKNIKAEQELIENIDIGGVSLLRAAAKNYQSVTVICDPADYAKTAEEFKRAGAISAETRRALALKAFEHTAAYDMVISEWLRSKLDKPELLKLRYEKARSLRYGENPHQRAAFFRNPENRDANVTNAKVLHGKELSFNNIVDANSALELVKEFKKPTAVFIKHNNPCGVASSAAIGRAFELSFRADEKSAFGSVVALNRPCTAAIANFIKKNSIFIELIICPLFEPAALAILKEKPNIRLLKTGKLKLDKEKRDIKKVAGGILVQTANTRAVTGRDLKTVTRRAPGQNQIRAMLFANAVCKHVMSNAVVFAKSHGADDITVGIGAGQMSRVDSVWIAAHKGGAAIKNSVMASDAFFPFPDAVSAAAKAGAKAIISPGGSIRDKEVIAAADKLKIAMVFTGVRLFRH